MVGAAPQRSERLRRDQKMHRREEFTRCYRHGRRRHGPLAVLHVHPNEGREPRLGMTVSRKVGKAVVRTQAKRRIREIFRRWSERHRLPALDVVVHLKPAAATAGAAELRREIERLLSTLLPEAGPRT